MARHRYFTAALVLGSLILISIAVLAVMLLTVSTETRPVFSPGRHTSEITRIAYLQGVLAAYAEDDTADPQRVEETAERLAAAYLTLLQANESEDMESEDRTQIDLIVIQAMETASSISQNSRLLKANTALLQATVDQIIEVQSRIVPTGKPDKRTAVLIAPIIAGSVLCAILIVLSTAQMRHKEPMPESEVTTGLPEEIKESIDAQSGGVTSTVFDLIMPREIYRMKRYGHSLSMLSVRIDGLTELLAAEGEDGVTYAITSLGETIGATTRASDLFARIGQNRFVLVLPETDDQGALKVAEKIRRNVEIYPYDMSSTCTISVGVAQCQEDEQLEIFLGRAENASKAAQSAGGNKILESD